MYRQSSSGTVAEVAATPGYRYDNSIPLVPVSPQRAVSTPSVLRLAAPRPFSGPANQILGADWKPLNFAQGSPAHPTTSLLRSFFTPLNPIQVLTIALTRAAYSFRSDESTLLHHKRLKTSSSATHDKNISLTFPQAKAPIPSQQAIPPLLPCPTPKTDSLLHFCDICGITVHTRTEYISHRRAHAIYSLAPHPAFGTPYSSPVFDPMYSPAIDGTTMERVLAVGPWTPAVSSRSHHLFYYHMQSRTVSRSLPDPPI